MPCCGHERQLTSACVIDDVMIHCSLWNFSCFAMLSQLVSKAIFSLLQAASLTRGIRVCLRCPASTYISRN